MFNLPALLPARLRASVSSREYSRNSGLVKQPGVIGDLYNLNDGRPSLSPFRPPFRQLSPSLDRSNDREPGHGGTLFLINVVARYLEAYNAAPFCRFRPG